MTMHWGKACLAGFVFAAGVHAAEAKSGLGMGGAFEGGYNYGMSPGQSSGAFLIDQFTLRNTYDASDKVKIVVNNGFAYVPPTSNVPTAANNGVNYLSPFRISGGGFTFSNLGAYLEHHCHEGWTYQIGHIRNPFGMESNWDRFDMPTYYYSAAGTNSYTLGWQYDLGLKVMTSIIPGKLEITAVDGRVAGGNLSPSFAARYSYDFGAGSDLVITPTISTYLGRFKSGINDLGATAGAQVKAGTLRVNAEFVYTSSGAVGAANKAKVSSLYVEPGMDLGVADVSAKWEMVNNDPAGTNTSDMNIGLSLGKTYSDKLRVRATYQHVNLGGKLGAHANDFRILLGTKW